MFVTKLNCFFIAGILTSLSSGLSPAQEPSFDKAFVAYAACSPLGGPNIVEITPLAPGVSERRVTTLKGSASVAMSAGRRFMFAYSEEDFFANMKVEVFAADAYAASRAALIDNFEYLLSSGDNTRNYKLKSNLNGFEIAGLDRSKREGGVLGVYLLLDDHARTATTIYFLNQEPPKRFHTMEEYAALRDRFLNSFTACVQNKSTSLK